MHFESFHELLDKLAVSQLILQMCDFLLCVEVRVAVDRRDLGPSPVGWGDGEMKSVLEKLFDSQIQQVS